MQGRTAAASPALLDRLAVELVESGWDVKHLVRLMVTSAAYRQGVPNSPGARGTGSREPPPREGLGFGCRPG